MIRGLPVLTLLATAAAISGVIAMGNPLQSGWPADLRLLFHCRPYGPVSGKPVVVRLKATLAGTILDEEYKRDRLGNTRLELRDPSRTAASFALLELAAENADRWVFYDQRTILVRRWPGPPPHEQPWSFGPFAPRWTDRHARVANHDARQVILRAPGDAAPAGECWISEELMLVLRERAAGPDGAPQEWEATSIELRDPGKDLAAVPEGFVVIDPQGRP